MVKFDVFTGTACACADPEGGQGVRTPPPPKNDKNIGFLLMAFCWQADDGLI